ncbi:MAG: helix-turn-helix transcriptional regulator [Cyanothece sp. SIO1E1]|nr:helix-turn-helix transcriptional regulator [Cyanothece sp. SIO1E1]
MKSKKPILESISWDRPKQSILAFATVGEAFEPYWHYHPEIELTLITQGSGIRFVGDSIESYQSGDLVLIGGNLPHHWVSKDTSNQRLQKAVVIQFQVQWLGQISELQTIAAFVRSANVGFHFQQVRRETQEKIKAFVDLPPPLRVSGLIEILFDLSSQLPRSLSQKTQFHLPDSTKEQERINQVISYIIDNLDQKLTVNHLADYSFMVPQAFCRWFRKHTGFSFITYLNKTRVEAACQLLLTSNLAVKQIAYQVGYENISHFNRTFKRHTSVSPLGFKREYLQRSAKGSTT